MRWLKRHPISLCLPYTYNFQFPQQIEKSQIVQRQYNCIPRQSDAQLVVLMLFQSHLRPTTDREHLKWILRKSYPSQFSLFQGFKDEKNNTCWAAAGWNECGPNRIQTGRQWLWERYNCKAKQRTFSNTEKPAARAGSEKSQDGWWPGLDQGLFFNLYSLNKIDRAMKKGYWKGDEQILLNCGQLMKAELMIILSVFHWLEDSVFMIHPLRSARKELYPKDKIS